MAKVPFFILSGVYGLLSAEEKIPDYDYELGVLGVEPLSVKIRTQLQLFGIQEIRFYTKLDKPKWTPYLHALLRAANTSQPRVHVDIHKLEDEA